MEIISNLVFRWNNDCCQVAQKGKFLYKGGFVLNAKHIAFFLDQTNVFELLFYITKCPSVANPWLLRKAINSLTD